MNLTKAVLVLGLCMAMSGYEPAYAHGGGLNAQGCHNNRKTGDYHCHRKPQKSEPTKAQIYNSKKAGVYYANCAEARRKTRTPIKAG